VLVVLCPPNEEGEDVLVLWIIIILQYVHGGHFGSFNVGHWIGSAFGHQSIEAIKMTHDSVIVTDQVFGYVLTD
jgi:hypothetical protein